MKEKRKRINAKQVQQNRNYRESKREVSTARSPKKPVDLDFEKPPKGDPMAWLKCYLYEAFPLDFGKVHKDIEVGYTHAIVTGNDVEILGPRGVGKSTEVNGLSLRSVLEGETPFPVILPWDAKAKNRALRFWKNQLCFNERLHRDYPEATAVFKESRGIGNRLTALTQGNEATGAMLAINEGIIVLPHGLGAIGSSTINGNPRGMNYTSIDGRVIRPSLAIIDDPQDRETAKSQKLIQQTIEIINGDIKGMAGPDSRMPIVMMATIIEPDDVPDTYSRDPNWYVVRTGQVITWPNGWEDKTSECVKHWNEWNEIRVTEGDDSALIYFLQHQKVMTDGMTVSWDARYDKKRKQPNALYSAMVDYFAMGEDAFFAERQNAPIKKGVDVYTLSPEIILSRTVDREPFALPEWSELIVTATDINPSYALSSATYAFGRDRTAACLWYGLYEDAPLPTNDEMSETQRHQIVYGALWKHGEQILKHHRRGKMWAIDGGGAQSTPVKRFCAEWNRVHPEMQAMTCYGKAGKNARVSERNEKIRRRAIDGSWLFCREKDSSIGWVEWINWDSNHWREIMQRAFTCETGAPGGATLPKGHHREYAEHLCRDKLKGKVELNGKMLYDYEKAPGRNDLGDASNMCWMLADMQGIGTGNGVMRQQQPRPQRRIRHVAI